MTETQSPPVSDSNLLNFVLEFEPEILAEYVIHEHPQVAALIISMIDDPQYASQVLLHIPDQDHQVDVAYRITTMGFVPLGIQTQIASVLASEMKNISHAKKVGGTEAMKKIIEAGGTEAFQGILAKIEAEAPEVAYPLKALDPKTVSKI